MKIDTLKKIWKNGETRYYIKDLSIFDKINSFTYSIWFYSILAIISCILWHFNASSVAIVFYLFLLSIFLIIQKDVSIIVPIILFALISISDVSNVGELTKMWWALIPVGLSIIFHIVYYKIESFSIGRMFYPYIAITIACLLGGILSDYQGMFVHNLVNTLIVAGVPFLCYILLKNYIVPRKDKDYTKLVARFFLLLGVAIFIELALWVIKNPMALQAGYVPHLGWSISNTVATVLLFAIPMGFYLFVKENKFKYVYLLLSGLSVVGILITTSRGAFLFGGIVTVLSFIITIFYTKGSERTKYLFLLGIIVVIALTLMYVIKDKIMMVINIIFHDKFKTSGRFELYQEAIQCFFKFPLFGVGLSYPGVNAAVIDDAHLYMFHSTAFQIIASLGIVGIVAYVYYYFVRVESLLENFNIYNMYLILIYIGFEGYSLINTGTITGVLFGPLVALCLVSMEINSKLSSNIKIKNIKL